MSTINRRQRVTVTLSVAQAKLLIEGLRFLPTWPPLRYRDRVALQSAHVRLANALRPLVKE